MTKKIDTIEAILRAGASGDFWQIICKEIDKEIESCERERDSDNLAKESADIYKLAMENIKDKIKHLRAIKNYPETIAQNIENPIEEEDPDPYDKGELNTG